MSNLNIPNVVPDFLSLQGTTSASKSILRKNLMELVPQSQTDYSPSQNQLIRFNLSSNSDFFVGSESFLRFDLEVTPSEEFKQDVPIFFGRGGVHNLFRSIEVRDLSSGMLIQRHEYYNRCNAMLSLVHEDEQWASKFGYLQGDAYKFDEYETQFRSLPLQTITDEKLQFINKSGAPFGTTFTMKNFLKRIPIDEPEVKTYDKDGNVVYAYSLVHLSNNVLSKYSNNVASQSPQIKVLSRVPMVSGNNVAGSFDIQGGGQAKNGDTFNVDGETGSFESAPNGSIFISANGIFRKDSLTLVTQLAYASDAAGNYNDNATVALELLLATVVPSLTDPASITAPLMTAQILSERNATFVKNGKNPGAASGESALGSRKLNLSTTQFVMELRASALQLTLPLMLTKGIEIIFELENADEAFASPFTIETYTIKTPRIMGMMVTPHPDIVETYANQWKSSEGLVYRIPSYRTRRVFASQSDEASTTFSVPVGVRSAQKVYFAIMPQSWMNSNDYTKDLFVQGNITKYQLKVGSHEFPHRDVEIGPYKWRESIIQTLHNAEAYQKNIRMKMSNVELSLYNEPTDWLYCVDMRRAKGTEDALTGVDLSIVPLDFVIDRSGNSFGNYWVNDADGNPLTRSYAGAKPVYYICVEHDAYLQIASTGMKVML